MATTGWQHPGQHNLDLIFVRVRGWSFGLSETSDGGAQRPRSRELSLLPSQIGRLVQAFEHRPQRGVPT
jgi:hypothetical protein